MNQDPSSNEFLANCLREAHSKAKDGVVKSSDLGRVTREKLIKANYLSEVIRGWYLLTTPSGAGTTELWYCNYWKFLKHYLPDRFGHDGYCLSAESSVDLYASQNHISDQIIVLTKKKTNTKVSLLYGTSIFLYTDPNFPETKVEYDGLNILPLAQAVVELQSSYFTHKSINAQIILNLIPVVELSRELLKQGSSVKSSRIVNAYKVMGLNAKSKRLESDLGSLGIKIKNENPFEERNIIFDKSMKAANPAALRVEGLLKEMRDTIIELFPPQKLPNQSYLKIIEWIYGKDAYHSLSIEGYQVTEELIEKVKNNDFDPYSREQDKELINTLAARGYYDSFRAVSSSIKKVIAGQNTGKVFCEDLQEWYRQLFAPLVKAKILNPGDLAGYRNHQVFIKGSSHVPPRSSAVLDCMQVLEKFLCNEKEASVRAVLGHFFLGYIHPYSDGNGRISRFLMNLNLISGGYNWTVIRMARREEYLDALETASSQYDIGPFTHFILEEMNHWAEFVDNLKAIKKE